MNPFISKTLGGLSRQYYIRQFIFSLLFPGLMILMASASSKPSPFSPSMVVFLCINCLLYPYARFIYERIVSFITGDNIFIVNLFIMVFVKIITMLLCWSFAIFIAPIGLAYLFYYHSKHQA